MNSLNAFMGDLGVIACTCVIEGEKPVLFVAHTGADWQMYCSDYSHDFNDPNVIENDLWTVHVQRLTMQDDTLFEVSDLPIDMAAEREFVGAEWRRFDNKEED